MTAPDAPVVLFDGRCGLCTGVVRFVLPRDRDGRIRFAPLEGRFAREALARHGKEGVGEHTVVLVLGAGTPRERLLLRSAAVLALAALLPWPWRLGAALAVVPRGLLDLAYDAVARVRHRVFPRPAACFVPSADVRDRFLEA